MSPVVEGIKMSINKLPQWFLIFLLSILNMSYATQATEIKPSQDYMFLLLFSDEKDKNFYFLKFGLGNLKKCHFPSGPSISNDFSIHEFYNITQEIWEKINNSSISLSMFCIEEPIVDFTEETKFIKKCGFELPSDKSVSYLFDLDNNFHNINGVIILKNELDKILSGQQEETQFDFGFSVEIPEDPEGIRNIDPVILKNFVPKPDSRFVSFLKAVGGPLCTKFYATSDFIVKYKKKLIEFFKNKKYAQA